MFARKSKRNMENRFAQYWDENPRSPLRRTLIVSIVLHLLAGLLVFQYYRWQTQPTPPQVYQVQVINANQDSDDSASSEETAPEAPPVEPEPEPTPPEPEPEPTPPPP